MKIDEKPLPGAVTVTGGPGSGPQGQKLTFPKNDQEVTGIMKIDEKPLPGAVTVTGGPGSGPQGQKSNFA